MNPRRLLLELFDAALRAVDGEHCVASQLRDRAFPAPVALIAVGKAAASMALGAHRALGQRIASTLVITKHGHLDPRLGSMSSQTILESAHPVPDESSLAAGDVLLDAVQSLSATVFPLFLISGGSSSLVEKLAEGATLTDLRELNQRGLAAGWDIRRLNQERSRLSRLKAGGIARLLRGRAALALFISDVPGDDPDVIGSGLLGRDSAAPDAVERVIVASVDSAMQAVVDAATARGFSLAREPGRCDGDVVAAAPDFVSRLRGCLGDGLVWGGETTVTLPASPGRGGRNTHLALTAARALRGNDSVTLLAAGTDGTDGPTDDAGAIVDSGTVERAEIAGVDVERALRDFDSGTALEASGDLVHTGPTGTNVGDILIGIKTNRRYQGRGPALS
jgi:glycerate 2-kinase